MSSAQKLDDFPEMLGGCCEVEIERKKLYCCKVSTLYRQDRE